MRTGEIRDEREAFVGIGGERVGGCGWGVDMGGWVWVDMYRIWVGGCGEGTVVMLPRGAVGCRELRSGTL